MSTRLTPDLLARIRQYPSKRIIAAPSALRWAVESLLAELDAVTAERDAAQKDSARLDFLQNDQGRCIYPTAAFEGKPWACGERAYSELRTALDDAMSWPKPPYPIAPHTPGRADALAPASSDSAASIEGGKPEEVQP